MVKLRSAVTGIVAGALMASLPVTSAAAAVRASAAVPTAAMSTSTAAVQDDGSSAGSGMWIAGIVVLVTVALGILIISKSGGNDDVVLSRA